MRKIITHVPLERNLYGPHPGRIALGETVQKGFARNRMGRKRRCWKAYLCIGKWSSFYHVRGRHRNDTEEPQSGTDVEKIDEIGYCGETYAICRSRELRTLST